MGKVTPPRNPCSTCGKKTRAATKVCLACQRKANPPRPSQAWNLNRPPIVSCQKCGIVTRAKGGTCRPCKSGRPHRPQPAAPHHALSRGRWVPIHGVQHWVPDGIAVGDYADQRARRDRLLQALTAERRDASWWTRPAGGDDPQVTSRRVAAMVADFDGLDERVAS